MTFRPSDGVSEKALAALTREAAEEAMPDLDWDRIEKNLLLATERASAAPATSSSTTIARPTSGVRWTSPPPSWASTPWAAAFASAAAAVLIYGASGGVRAPEPQERAHLTSPRPPAFGFSSLDVGEIAETGVLGEVYNRPGPVSFMLAPNSRIEVVANDIEKAPSGGITFALARGSIAASVTPRTEGEVFAVEVERTRVAAHGTSFTVTRDGQRVIVEVAHGSVAVGPVGHRGATQGWLVAAPARAVFSLDGAREAAWSDGAPASEPAATPAEPPSAAAVDALPSHSKRVASTPSAPSARVEAISPASKSASTAAPAARPGSSWGEGATVDGRSPSEQEAAAVAAIVRELDACYEKQVSAFAVHFSVESSLTLTLLPSGAIREGLFTPPLSPTLMTCANNAIGAAHFPKGETVRQIEIPVQLSRASR